MLELALLGLLKDRPMHGYDLRKRLRDGGGPLANLSFGSLYPALARLEASGAVRSVAGERTRAGEPEIFVPPTGSIGGERAALVARRATAMAAAALSGRGGRGRKVYEITSRGQELFEQLLEPGEGSEDARAFSVKLTFARHLSPAARLRLLERRRITVADRLARTSQALAAPSRPFDRYERAIAKHARDSAALELSFVEALLEREQGSSEAAPPLGTAAGRGRESTGRIRTR